MLFRSSQHQLSVDNQGLLNVNLHDNSGNALNSTSNALNTYITNTVPISGSISNTSFKSQLQDNSGNALNSTSNALNTYITNTSLTTTNSNETYNTGRLTVYDASANSILTTINTQTNKLTFDSNNYLITLPPRTTSFLSTYGQYSWSDSTYTSGFGQVIDTNTLNIPYGSQFIITMSVSSAVSTYVVFMLGSNTNTATSDYYPLSQGNMQLTASSGTFLPSTSFKSPPCRYLRVFSYNTTITVYSKIFWTY